MIITNNTKQQAKVRALALGLLLAALTAACLLLGATPALAETTFAVDRTDDPDPATVKACTANPNDCSLRGAIVAANAATGADEITVPAGTYTLTRAGDFEDAASTGDLDVTAELTITGAGARTTSVAAGAAPYADRIFENLPGAKTTVTGIAMTGGDAGGYEGGGVRNQGDLTLDGVVIKDSTAYIGGAIDSRIGNLTLDAATLEGNTSKYGAGIYSDKGTLNITDSTVSGNSATDSYGGVVRYGGPANITNSTISGNKAASFGGGVVVASAVVNVRNSTIASNEAGGLGGGIMSFGQGTLVLVKNTIVAGNSIDNCDTAQYSGGIIRSQGNNISSDDSCPFTQPADKQNTNPRLGPLQDNGGSTDTRALLAGSPAIDAGSNTDCPVTDQRGVTRPQGTACDIGAFEFRHPPVARNDAFKVKRGKTLKVSAPGVLKNDSDADKDPLTARLVTGPSKGTLNLNPDGSFSYKPNVKRGSDSFTYEADDGNGGTDKATVSIKIVRR